MSKEKKYTHKNSIGSRVCNHADKEKNETLKHLL